MAVMVSLPPLALERSPGRVLVGARVVACDWCSLDGVPYTRVVKGSEHASDDTIHLCDGCAGELELALERRRRMTRRPRTKPAPAEAWTVGFVVRVLAGRDIARELPIDAIDHARFEPFKVGRWWYRRSSLQAASEVPPPALRGLRRKRRA